MKDIKSIAFLFLVLVSVVATGQSVSSVYSNRGVGLINYQGLPHNVGMGEVGIGTPAVSNINLVNPAFLPLNASTQFQVGLEMDRRKISSSEIETRSVAGGMRFFSLSFPVVAGKWTSALGISPYSTVNNRTFSGVDLSDQTKAIISYRGSGGLTAYQWSNGFHLKKGLYVGGRVSFVAGSTINQETTYLTDSLYSLSVDFMDQSSFRGAKFDVALGYRKTLGDNRVINFGLIYENRGELNARQNQWLINSTLAKTLIVENEPFQYPLPSTVGVGISYQILNKLILGVDFSTSNWSINDDGIDRFRDTYKVAVGGQFIPDYASVTNYLKRVSYRAGFNFGSIPVVINGVQINELGINFGGSFPVGYSNLDWAFKYGRLGTLENGLIRENYFRIVIGATMSDRWFIKRRYD